MSDMSVLAAVAAALLLAGGWIALAGVRQTEVQGTGPSRTLPGSPVWRRMTRLSRRTQLRLVWGLGVGLVAALVTGWVITVVVVPLAFVGLPYLLGASDENEQTARLEAMEEWTRSLAGVLTVGSGLEQALTVTLRSVPNAIRPEVETLVARLQARWPTDAAIRVFADDLNDATGDRIAANLLLNAQRRGPGLAAVLENLAESVSIDVRSRRAIEADRAKPRTTARWITIITVVVFGLLMLNRQYVESYQTPLGQIVLSLVLIAYVVILIWMKSMTRGTPLPRFIGQRVREKSGA